MRERLALLVLASVAALVLALAAWFAYRHNPDELPSEDATTAQVKEAARGRQLFADLHCQLCHALAGEGNPRLPLDGVGAHFEPDDLRESIRGDFRDLSSTVKERKQRYRELPAKDLDALVVFLSSQRAPGAP
jgi:mono/diheme cytochrome c family protein